MGKTVVAARAIAVHHIERLIGESDTLGAHDVGEPAPACRRIIAPQTDNIGTVQIAQFMNVVHETINGALQTRKVGREIVFDVIHFARVHQPHALRDEAVGVGIVGFDNSEVDE